MHISFSTGWKSVIFEGKKSALFKKGEMTTHASEFHASSYPTFRINDYLCNQIMKKITLITGGQRSGKSAYAESLALSLSPTPVYLATAHIWDEEFRQRVLMHQQRRGQNWTNIEEEKYLSRRTDELRGRVVVVDCITLWCTNFFFDRTAREWEQPSVDEALEQLKQEFDLLTAVDATFIFVTNEIGSGGVSESAVQRRFTDLEGWMNQYVASKADEVVLMVSGIAVKIK